MLGCMRTERAVIEPNNTSNIEHRIFGSHEGSFVGVRVNTPRGQFDNGGGTTHFRKATGVALNLGINQGRIKGRELPKRLHFSTYLGSVRTVGGQG